MNDQVMNAIIYFSYLSLATLGGYIIGRIHQKIIILNKNKNIYKENTDY